MLVNVIAAGRWREGGGGGGGRKRKTETLRQIGKQTDKKRNGESGCLCEIMRGTDNEKHRQRVRE